jgi:hypothetical protein
MIAPLPYPRHVDTRIEMDESALFVVRVWRTIAGGFRASVRRDDEEQAHSFTAADQVARYFEQVEPPAQDGTSPTQPPLKEAP